MYCQVPNTARPSQIGTSFPHCSLYVIKDETIQPRGAIGELCIGGAHVARGYCNRPELTEKSFLIGYAGIEERIYRTGDLCRMLQDGSIEFLGRNDDQVKILGRRLQLGEVAKVLEMVCSTEMVVIHVNPDKFPVDDSYLTAFYKADSELVFEREAKTISKWFERCRSEVAQHMVPRYIMPVLDIPRNMNGKVDTKMLFNILDEFLASNQHMKSTLMGMDIEVWDAVNEDLENRIQLITQNLFQKEVDVLEPLAVYGLDSLTVIQLRYLLKAQGWSFTAEELFRLQSVRRLALHIMSLGSDRQSEITLVKNRSPESICEYWYEQFGRQPKFAGELWLPCSAGQIFWIDEWVREKGKQHVGTFMLDIPHEIHNPLEALDHAWNEAVKCIPILRSSLHRWCHPACPWYQVVHPYEHQRVLEVVTPKKLGFANAFVNQVIFDTLDTPPVRCSLVRFPDGYAACIQIHHALYDGSSMDFLLQLLKESMEKESRMVFDPEEEIAGFFDFLKQQYGEMDTRLEKFYLRSVKQTLVPKPSQWRQFKSVVAKSKLTHSVYSKGTKGLNDIPMRALSGLIHGLTQYLNRDDIVVSCVDHNRVQLSGFPTMVRFPLVLSTNSIKNEATHNWIDFIRTEYAQQFSKNPHRLDYGLEEVLTNVDINILYQNHPTDTSSYQGSVMNKLVKKKVKHYTLRDSLLHMETRLEVFITPHEMHLLMICSQDSKTLFKTLCQSIDVFFQ
jgi:aryl carrier-like protein